MRSVFAHLKSTTKTDVITVLDEICHAKNSNTGEDWVWMTTGDTVLYIRFYSDYEEFEPDEWQELTESLGGEPVLSVVADVSGSHPGKRESVDFLSCLLAKFEGVAQDDYTNHGWTLQELQNDSLYLGHPFLDSQGWYEENKRMRANHALDLTPPAASRLTE